MDLIQSKMVKFLYLKNMKTDPVEIKNKIGFVYSETYFNDKWTAKS